MVTSATSSKGVLIVHTDLLAMFFLGLVIGFATPWWIRKMSNFVQAVIDGHIGIVEMLVDWYGQRQRRKGELWEHRHRQAAGVPCNPLWVTTQENEGLTLVEFNAIRDAERYRQQMDRRPSGWPE